eukprot:m.72232 g.72232  ORF g.72232 m.72232 type:complete len:349 (+) comp14238_c1_seq1:457-1503(+)
MAEVLADATPVLAADVAETPATPSTMTACSAGVREAAAQATRSISPHPPTTAPTVAPRPASLSSSSTSRPRARMMATTTTTTPATAAVATTTKAAAYTATATLPRGPPRPSVNRLLAICGKDEDEVKSALGLDELAWHNVVWNRVPAIERWAPVLAKCTLLSRRGLVQLLTKQSPNAPTPTMTEKPTEAETQTQPDNSNEGAQSSSQQQQQCRRRTGSHSSPSPSDGDSSGNGTDDVTESEQADTADTNKETEEADKEAAAAADTAPDERTVGRTVYESLRQRGDSCVALCREALTKGWVGWERWRLTEAQVDAFFAGVCDEAEQVADFLLKLGQATDPTNLYSLFVV